VVVCVFFVIVLLFFLKESFFSEVIKWFLFYNDVVLLLPVSIGNRVNLETTSMNLHS
jgi:hypothetical protein